MATKVNNTLMTPTITVSEKAALGACTYFSEYFRRIHDGVDALQLRKKPADATGYTSSESAMGRTAPQGARFSASVSPDLLKNSYPRFAIDPGKDAERFFFRASPLPQRGLSGQRTWR